MSRTRAEALVLVNWKGVFYERYLLDRHVTALEGANGAGKTTVMIAAYVVLLPDMSRLRFTNLGETGATGGDKGIWGRLGEPGRPSYAALDFALSGSRRLIAGVHLERKGEPSLEPTPFLVSGLEADVRLQDLLLVKQGESEVVPELGELRENAARLGGRLQVFTSARDYFAALFDQGVTPLRLGTDEERNKLNEMLRTSMTGGISRALTSELRSFLLKEEGGLADTLQRMKAALDACRRTRTEVQESQKLEREIGGIFEAGQTMFVAAFLATRERAEEWRRKVAESELARRAAAEALELASAAYEQVRQDLASAQARRGTFEAALEQARQLLSRLLAALAAAEEVTRRQNELATENEQAQAAATERAQAAAARELRRTELRRAQESHKLAARGLADLQSGLDELHRRAGAYRQTLRRRDEATRLLAASDPLALVDELASRLGESREALEKVDHERRDGAQRLADADAHRREHAEVFAALRHLASGEVDEQLAHATALEQLRRLRDLHSLAGRKAALQRDENAAREQAKQQIAAQERAQALGIVLAEGPAGEQVHRLLEQAEDEKKRLEEAERAARTQLEQTQRLLEDALSRRRELKERQPLWRDLDERARRLGEALGSALGSTPEGTRQLADRADLDAARAEISARLEASRRHESELAQTRENLIQEARDLLAAGGPFAPELLRLRDELAADLFAAGFENAEIGEAARLEARLGPLVQALVVDDKVGAARAIADRPAGLEHVWLLEREPIAELMPGITAAGDPGESGTDVWIEEGKALRVSRLPQQPRLGRLARERRAAALRAEAALRERELEEERSRRRELERLVEDGEALLAGLVLWLGGDPAAELAVLHRRLLELEAEAERLRAAAQLHAEEARALRPRLEGLRRLLPEALLLDPPDHTARAEALGEELRAAIAAQEEIARCGEAFGRLEAGLDVLRRPPLSPQAFAELGRRVELLREERDRLEAAIDAMGYVALNLAALAWADAPVKLEQSAALVPALEDQLRRAEVAVENAERSADAAETGHEQATSRWQEAEARRLTAGEQLAAAKSRLLETGIEGPTEEAASAARDEARRLENELLALAQKLDALAQESGRKETASAQAAERSREAEERATSDRREAEPAMERWDQLQALATQHQLLKGVLATEQGAIGQIRGHVNLVQEAHKQRAVLVERLRPARGGPELLKQAFAASETADLLFADTYLALWLTLRDWLRRRLPAQVAEVDDPREALLRLRDQLQGLEERLERQEGELRGNSEDVARGIDVQIRKARGQVKRLCQNLVGVRFGSIEGIRVRLQPVDKMEQVLRALREGAVQGLLFQDNLPIEEALDEIFRRHGGGRSGGQRLLDYREYVHLQVEIRRSAGQDWEIANPTRLSTGEAIGVGAALMMVVLTEWERDANLLRGKPTSGSLRFLFLDEANRLSHDNLGVLFDLCQTLDLQLLIAAPEVARAEGNTTYRLVRHKTADGREEVLVSGRRTRAG